MLSIKEKERIGKLFKYYRKKNKIQWKEIEKICSTSTYSRIEKGIPLKNNETYEKLFDLYRISYVYKENFEEWLNDYLIRFDHILKYFIEDQFELLVIELKQELGSLKNSIVYEQYFRIFSFILNYYKNSQYMTLEDIGECLELLEYFELKETLKDYLMEVMFISNSNKHANYEIQENIFQYIETNKNPIILHVLGYYYKSIGNLDTALSLFEELSDYWSIECNNYRYIRALMGKFVIYKNIDNNKSNKLAEYLIEKKKDGTIIKSLLPSLNFNIGMYYFLNKEYKKALPLFEENIFKFQTFRERVYLCIICNYLNIPIKEEIFNIDLNNPHRLYLEYFKLKRANTSKKQLVDYIMSVIIPNKLIYQVYEQPFWKIYEHELFEICKKDKRYMNKYLEYLEKKKKTCKDA